MAINKVSQREIVEVPFYLPNGDILPHPAMVLSCDDLQNVEPGMFYAVLISSKNHFPDITIPIQPGWLSTPLPMQSYIVTHIIGMYNVSDVIKRSRTFMRKEYFDSVLLRINEVIIDGDW